MSSHFLNCVVSSAVITLCSALCFGTAGCGDDDDTVADSGSSASTDSGNSESDSGISAVDARTYLDGKVADAGSRPSVICGAKQCTVIPEGEPFIKPCCLKEDLELCGASYLEDDECQAMNQEGAIDARCPSHTPPGNNNMTMRGCCKPNGQCGVSSSIGFGCVERTQLTAYVGGPLPALDCDATDEDAGL